MLDIVNLLSKLIIKSKYRYKNRFILCRVSEYSSTVSCV